MGSRFSLDVEGMQKRTKEYDACTDIDKLFGKMHKIDDSLVAIDSIITSSTLTGLSSLGYQSQSGDIDKLKDNLKILGVYPVELIKELYDGYDCDFATEMSGALNGLMSVKIDDIQYKDSSSGELIKIPSKELRSVINKVTEVLENPSLATVSQLVGVYRTTEDKKLKSRLGEILKDRYRRSRYSDNSELAEFFPTLKEEDTISDYEATNRNDKRLEELNNFLDDCKTLTEEDKIHIKYMVYTADPTFRDGYLDNLSKYKIRKTDLEGDAFYTNGSSEKKKGIYFTYSKHFYYDERGRYITFFHESGHATDANIYAKDIKHSATTYATMTYVSEKKRYNQLTHQYENCTLRNTLEYDVFDNPNNKHSVESVARDKLSNTKYVQYSDADKDQMILHVKEALRVKNGVDSLNVDEKSVYNSVVKEIKDSVKGPQRNSPSDVYGGLTYNELKGGYGHSDDYYDGAWNPMDKDYYSPGKEVWAQWFSFKMTGNEQMIAMEEEFFPATTEFLEEFAEYEFKEK